jgi:hypothetical protein
MDIGHVSLLVLLDLTCAFDTVSHDVLLQKLSSIGLEGDAHNWFRRYLNDRWQSVRIGDSLSEPRCLKAGVPQGSVLGPVLFSIYLTGIEKVIQKHEVQFVIFADDIQLIITSPASHISAAAAKMEICIAELSRWLSSHSLALNAAKTEFVVLGTRAQLQKCQTNIQITVGSVAIPPNQRSVRDLGVQIDPTLTMNDHVTNICRKAYCSIRTISRLKRSITMRNRIVLVKSLVFSQLDYGAALLYNVDKKLLMKMTRVIRSAMRMACGVSKFDSISPVLKTNGVLSVESRIKLKILMITLKVVNTGMPEYLVELVEAYVPKRTLRSDNLQLLKEKKQRTVVGARRFEIAAPILWNLIPKEIREVKSFNSFREQVVRLLLTQDNE